MARIRFTPLRMLALASLVSGSHAASASVCTDQGRETRVLAIDGRPQLHKCDQQSCIVAEGEAGGGTPIAEAAASDGKAARVAADGPGLSIPITVAAPGDYTIWVRTRSRDLAQNVSVAVAGAPPQRLYRSSGTGWIWDTLVEGRRKPRRMQLSGGATNVEIRSSGGAIDVDCILLTRDPALRPGVPRVVEIDRGWSGTTAPFDAVADGNRIIVAYYDAERWLTVAEVDLETEKVRRVRVESRFEGWDAHNAIVVAVDGQGIVHVAGNMHASPLVYARSGPGKALDELARLRPMVGRDERETTYPTFLRRGSELLFIYRTGRSGDGAFIVDAWDGKAWQRRLDKPLTAESWQGKPVNAYPSAFAMGPDGATHVAFVWRTKMDAAANARLSYARSADVRSWKAADGRALPFPLAADTIDIVDDAPTGSGLLNNQKIGFDAAGRPVIAYSRYDKAGNNQIFLGRFDGKSWHAGPITDWQHRWVVAGGGTLPGNVEFTPPEPAGPCCVALDVSHWQEGRMRLIVDVATGKPTGREPIEQQLPNVERLVQSELQGAVPRLVRVSDAEGRPTPHWLRWEAMPSRRDKAPDCKPGDKDPCRPEPTLITLITRAK